MREIEQVPEFLFCINERKLFSTLDSYQTPILVKSSVYVHHISDLINSLCCTVFKSSSNLFFPDPKLSHLRIPRTSKLTLVIRLQVSDQDNEIIYCVSGRYLPMNRRHLLSTPGSPLSNCNNETYI